MFCMCEDKNFRKNTIDCLFLYLWQHGAIIVYILSFSPAMMVEGLNWKRLLCSPAMQYPQNPQAPISSMGQRSQRVPSGRMNWVIQQAFLKRLSLIFFKPDTEFMTGSPSFFSFRMRRIASRRRSQSKNSGSGRRSGV